MSTVTAAVEQARPAKLFFENELYDTRDKAGFVRHGFVLAVFFLEARHTGLLASMSDNDLFTYAIEQTVRLGGDTDTNACIVGAVVGALVQIDNIPSYQLQKVLECNIGAGKQSKRPGSVQPSKAKTVE